MRKLLILATVATSALAPGAGGMAFAAPAPQPALTSVMVDPRTGQPLDPGTAGALPAQPPQAPQGAAQATVRLPAPPDPARQPAPAAVPGPGQMPAAYLIPSQQQPAGASAPAGQPAGQLVFVPAGTPLPPGAQALAPPSHEAPATAAAQPPSPEDLAFQQALQSLLPLSAPQVTKYKQSLDETQRAVATPVGAAPRPVTSSIPLSLKPGEKQPRLRLYPGNATTLTFSDVTGAPWPVMSVTTGNPNAYVAQEAGERGKTNMVVISPLTTHAVANNLVVTLVNHPVPVIFTLETGVAEVDYRLDVSIQARGPNAAYDIVGSSTLAPTSDRTVQAFLDGVPPKGARKVSTSNGDVEAWKLNDLVYVRTPLELMSPAHVGRARNVSGTNVFTLIDAPVLVFSQDGRLASVTIGC